MENFVNIDFIEKGLRGDELQNRADKKYRFRLNGKRQENDDTLPDIWQQSLNYDDDDNNLSWFFINIKIVKLMVTSHAKAELLVK